MSLIKYLRKLISQDRDMVIGVIIAMVFILLVVFGTLLIEMFNV